MRAYGTLNSIEDIPQTADATQKMLLAAAVAQSFDWPSSTGGPGGAAANALENNTQLVRFTGITTGNAPLNFMVNLQSTFVTIPTSGTSVTTGTTAGSTGNDYPVVGSRMFQINQWSTGWSAIAQTSGWVIAEVWRK